MSRTSRNSVEFVACASVALAVFSVLFVTCLVFMLRAASSLVRSSRRRSRAFLAAILAMNSGAAPSRFSRNRSFGTGDIRPQSSVRLWLKRVVPFALATILNSLGIVLSTLFIVDASSEFLFSILGFALSQSCSFLISCLFVSVMVRWRDAVSFVRAVKPRPTLLRIALGMLVVLVVIFVTGVVLNHGLIWPADLIAAYYVVFAAAHFFFCLIFIHWSLSTIRVLHSLVHMPAGFTQFIQRRVVVVMGFACLMSLYSGVVHATEAGFLIANGHYDSMYYTSISGIFTKMACFGVPSICLIIVQSKAPTAATTVKRFRDRLRSTQTVAPSLQQLLLQESDIKAADGSVQTPHLLPSDAEAIVRNEDGDGCIA